MTDASITIHRQHFQKINKILARLSVESIARLVFLATRDGHPIASYGDLGDADTTSFSSLAAGNVAATDSMARLIGEDVFPAVIHEGERGSIYICVIGKSLLAVVFDERSTLSLVKLRAKKASHELAPILEEVMRVSENEREAGDSFFAKITDEDINGLFS